MYSEISANLYVVFYTILNLFEKHLHIYVLSSFIYSESLTIQVY